MKMTQDLTELLERLYNLKGEDNVIIAKIKKEIKAIEDHIVEEAEKQSRNEVTKVETESQLSIFVTQKEAFCSTFMGIDNDTFSALGAIGVDLDISNMLEKIEEKSPAYCAELDDKIAEAAKNIEDAKAARDKFNDELSKLNENLDSAKNDREKLVSLLEQSLSPNVVERESLTAKYAKDIINNFGVFSSSETSALAKVILFPEDGLIEFDETYDEKEHKDFSEEVEDNETPVSPEPEQVEDKEENVTLDSNVDNTFDTYKKENEGVIEDLASQTYQDIVKEDGEPTQVLDITSLNAHEENEEVVEDIAPINEQSLLEFNLKEEPIILSSNKEEEKVFEAENEEKVEEEVTPEEKTENTLETQEKVEEAEVDQYKELKASLENIGLEVNKFEDNNDDINIVLEALNSVDTKHIEENYEVLRSLNIEDNAIYQYRNNHIYLADKDLNKKVTLLRAKGVSEHKIKELILNVDSGFKEDYQVLEERITTIEETSEKISDDNIHLLSLDTKKYNENLNILGDNGFELDDKDLRNYQYVLYNSNNVKDDVEVLKNYLMSIQRKNGKYALGAFFKDSKGLLFDIDDIIEAKLEDLFEYPEILSNRADTLIARSRYALAHNESIFEDEENGSFNKNIVDGLKFYRTYHQDVNEYMPRDRKEVNSSLESLIDGCKEAVDTLDNYYEETTVFKDIELNDNETEMLNKLKNLLKEKLNISEYGYYTYLVDDIPVSKNKIERNLAILVKNKGSVEGMEKVLILSAMLYNLRQSDDILKQLTDSYDNNNSSKDGGEE